MSDLFLVAVEKCPLCESSRRKLTCCDCVREGSFSYCNEQDGETYSVKREKILAAVEKIKEPASRIQYLHERNANYEKKRLELLSLKFRLASLTEVVQNLDKQNKSEKVQLKERQKQYCVRSEAVEKVKRDATATANHLENALKVLSNHEDKLKKFESQVISSRKKAVKNLKHDIFPITIRPVYKEFGTPPRLTIATRGMSNDLVLEASKSAQTDLEEATKFTYEEGQWIQKNLSEMEYCISGPGLPASGDYFKYYEWLKSYRKEARGPDAESNIHANPALEIPAALTYTCQALKVASKILDVNLPHRMNSGDFANPYINQKKLFDSISKLNMNIIYLCFSQLVCLSKISPMQTLQNLDVCLSAENPNLGHFGDFETYDYDLPEMFTELDSDILEDLYFDSDDDEDDNTKEDWDSLTDLPEMPKDFSFAESGTSTSTEQSLSSSATGLVTSAAASISSLWPWKKNK